MQELATLQGNRQQPAAYEMNFREEIISAETCHPIMARLAVCGYYDAPKLTVILQNATAWTGMLLFSVSFYYGLARLVMWAASLRDVFEVN
jgi:hypothetical protein